MNTFSRPIQYFGITSLREVPNAAQNTTPWIGLVTYQEEYFVAFTL